MNKRGRDADHSAATMDCEDELKGCDKKNDTGGAMVVKKHKSKSRFEFTNPLFAILLNPTDLTRFALIYPWPRVRPVLAAEFGEAMMPKARLNKTMVSAALVTWLSSQSMEIRHRFHSILVGCDAMDVSTTRWNTANEIHSDVMLKVSCTDG